MIFTFFSTFFTYLLCLREYAFYNIFRSKYDNFYNTLGIFTYLSTYLCIDAKKMAQ